MSSMFSISEVAELMGVSGDTVRRWTDSGRLPVQRDAHGHRQVDGQDLAEFARTTAEGRLVRGSNRNRLLGIVTNVVRDTVMAKVEIQAGPYRIVSLVSRETADELNLECGVLAVATLKSTNIGVELPGQA